MSSFSPVVGSVPGWIASVRHDDRGLIVLEQGGQRADRRLVAGNDGDGAGEPGGAQMFAERIVRNFTPDQRVAHFARAVADAVRRCDGVFRLHQAQLQLARAVADAALEAGVDRIDLRRDAHIALAVALGADHADRRLVDQIRIGAKLARNPDGLGRAAWMAVYDDDFRFCHGEFLPSGRLVRSTMCRVRTETRTPGSVVSVGRFDCVATSGPSSLWALRMQPKSLWQRAGGRVRD